MTGVQLNKPRLRLHSSFMDCGFRYDLWVCHAGDIEEWGGSPKSAYENYLEMINVRASISEKMSMLRSGAGEKKSWAKL